MLAPETTENTERLKITEAIRGVFSDVLRRKDFQDDAKFFDLGGTSIGLLSVVARICGRFKIDVELNIAAGGSSVSAFSRAVSDILENENRGAMEESCDDIVGSKGETRLRGKSTG